MEIILKDRGRGKTTKLLKLAQENKYCFVCTDRCEFTRIKAMHLDGLFLLTFDDLQAQKHRGRSFNGIVIDDVDMIVPNTIWTQRWENDNTISLIKLSAKYWKYISVFNPEVAEFVSSTADELGADIPFPVLHSDNPCGKPILFHDPETYLQAIANRYPIKCVTTTRLDTISYSGSHRGVTSLQK